MVSLSGLEFSVGIKSNLYRMEFSNQYSKLVMRKMLLIVLNTSYFVIDSLMDVCEHTLEQAEQCTILVHYKGKCTVKTGEYEDLEPRCTKLLSLGLSAEII